MRIGGFQPLSLSDYPGKTCAVVFTQGCPFRCHYCHNPELIPMTSETVYEESQILDELKKRSGILDGVCVTGGEPTVQPDLKEFLRALKHLGLLVKLDTNGVHPRLLESIFSEGLVDFVAMDLKHRFEAYEDVIDVSAKAFATQLQTSKRLIEESGIAYEFRTTVWGDVHKKEDLIAIAQSLPRGAQYALQPVRSVVTLSTKIMFTPGVNLDEAVKEIVTLRPDLQVEIRG